MNSIRTLAGIIAVIFSIQPLAVWAAGETGEKSPPKEREIKIMKSEKGGDTKPEGCGSPACSACGARANKAGQYLSVW